MCEVSILLVLKLNELYDWPGKRKTLREKTLQKKKKTWLHESAAKIQAVWRGRNDRRKVEEKRRSLRLSN